MTGGPFRIAPPASVAFSGGRTSAYMLRQILDAHGGALPADVIVAFQNTGKEMPETLDFVAEVSRRWGVDIVWLEYRAGPAGEPDTFERVGHNSASRNGEPFAALIAKRRYLPNQAQRFCTGELKIRTLQRYIAATYGWSDYAQAVGFRADEPRRVAKMRANPDARMGMRRVEMPLADAGVTRRDVVAFWRAQPFDLRLPNVNGATPLGNCDCCFLKSFPTLTGILRDRPELGRWWIQQERNTYGRAGTDGGRFRRDRPTYAEMAAWAQVQGDFERMLATGDPWGVECDYFDQPAEPCLCHAD